MERKNIYLSFIVLFFFAFSACSQDTLNTLELKIVEAGELSLPSKNKTDPTVVQYVEKENILMLVFNNSDSIYIWDIKTKELIAQLSIGYKFSLNSVTYLSKDSIYCFYNPPHREEDSSIVRIDINGQIKEFLKLENTPLYLSDRVNAEDEKYYLNYNFDKYIIHNNQLFLTFNRYGSEPIGSPDFNINKEFVAGHLNLKNNVFIRHNNVEPPFLYEKAFYPTRAKKSYSVIGHNGTIIYAYAHTNVVREYYISEDSVKSYRFRSILTDSVFPLKEVSTSSFSGEQFNYGLIYYDKYRKYYYRTLQLPKNKFGILHSFIVADTSFRHIAEGSIPKGFNNLALFFTKDFIYSYNYDKTQTKEDSIVFTKYKPRFVHNNSEAICSAFEAKQLNLKRPQEITQYIEKYHHIKGQQLCCCYSACFLELSFLC